jgi:hypothetical protein
VLSRRDESTRPTIFNGLPPGSIHRNQFISTHSASDSSLEQLTFSDQNDWISSRADSVGIDVDDSAIVALFEKSGPPSKVRFCRVLCVGWRSAGSGVGLIDVACGLLGCLVVVGSGP